MSFFDIFKRKPTGPSIDELSSPPSGNAAQASGSGDNHRQRRRTPPPPSFGDAPVGHSANQHQRQRTPVRNNNAGPGFGANQHQRRRTPPPPSFGDAPVGHSANQHQRQRTPVRNNNAGSGFGANQHQRQRTPPPSNMSLAPPPTIPRVPDVQPSIATAVAPRGRGHSVRRENITAGAAPSGPGRSAPRARSVSRARAARPTPRDMPALLAFLKTAAAPQVSAKRERDAEEDLKFAAAAVANLESVSASRLHPAAISVLANRYDKNMGFRVLNGLPKVLPVLSKMGEFMEAKAPYVNFVSPTGTGKSMCMPIFMMARNLHDLLTKPGAKTNLVAMVLPKRTPVDQTKKNVKNQLRLLNTHNREARKRLHQVEFGGVPAVMKCLEDGPDSPTRTIFVALLPDDALALFRALYHRGYLHRTRWILDEIHERTAGMDILLTLLARTRVREALEPALPTPLVEEFRTTSRASMICEATVTIMTATPDSAMAALLARNPPPSGGNPVEKVEIANTSLFEVDKQMASLPKKGLKGKIEGHVAWIAASMISRMCGLPVIAGGEHEAKKKRTNEIMAEQKPLLGNVLAFMAGMGECAKACNFVRDLIVKSASDTLFAVPAVPISPDLDVPGFLQHASRLLTESLQNKFASTPKVKVPREVVAVLPMKLAGQAMECERDFALDESGLKLPIEQNGVTLVSGAKISVRIVKFIAATNAVESSVTIPGLSVVVDSGFHKEGTYDPVKDVKCLTLATVPESSAKQRAGRCGRTQPGWVWRVVTEDYYERQTKVNVNTTVAPSADPEAVLEDLPLNGDGGALDADMEDSKITQVQGEVRTPELLSSDLARRTLSLLTQDIDMSKIWDHLPTPVRAERFLPAYEKLKRLRAVQLKSNGGYAVTRIGQILSTVDESIPVTHAAVLLNSLVDLCSLGNNANLAPEDAVLLSRPRNEYSSSVPGLFGKSSIAQLTNEERRAAFFAQALVLCATVHGSQNLVMNDAAAGVFGKLSDYFCRESDVTTISYLLLKKGLSVTKNGFAKLSRGFWKDEVTKFKEYLKLVLLCFEPGSNSVMPKFLRDAASQWFFSPLTATARDFGLAVDDVGSNTDDENKSAIGDDDDQDDEERAELARMRRQVDSFWNNVKDAIALLQTTASRDRLTSLGDFLLFSGLRAVQGEPWLEQNRMLFKSVINIYERPVLMLRSHHAYHFEGTLYTGDINSDDHAESRVFDRVLGDFPSCYKEVLAVRVDRNDTAKVNAVQLIHRVPGVPGNIDVVYRIPTMSNSLATATMEYFLKEQPFVAHHALWINPSRDPASNEPRTVAKMEPLKSPVSFKAGADTQPQLLVCVESEEAVQSLHAEESLRLLLQGFVGKSFIHLQNKDHAVMFNTLTKSGSWRGDVGSVLDCQNGLPVDSLYMLPIYKSMEGSCHESKLLRQQALLDDSLLEKALEEGAAEVVIVGSFKIAPRGTFRPTTDFLCSTLSPTGELSMSRCDGLAVETSPFLAIYIDPSTDSRRARHIRQLLRPITASVVQRTPFTVLKSDLDHFNEQISASLSTCAGAENLVQHSPSLFLKFKFNKTMKGGIAAFAPALNKPYVKDRIFQAFKEACGRKGLEGYDATLKYMSIADSDNSSEAIVRIPLPEHLPEYLTRAFSNPRRIFAPLLAECPFASIDEVAGYRLGAQLQLRLSISPALLISDTQAAEPFSLHTTYRDAIMEVINASLPQTVLYKSSAYANIHQFATFVLKPYERNTPTDKKEGRTFSSKATHIIRATVLDLPFESAGDNNSKSSGIRGVATFVDHLVRRILELDTRNLAPIDFDAEGLGRFTPGLTWDDFKSYNPAWIWLNEIVTKSAPIAEKVRIAKATSLLPKAYSFYPSSACFLLLNPSQNVKLSFKLGEISRSKAEQAVPGVNIIATKKGEMFVHLPLSSCTDSCTAAITNFFVLTSLAQSKGMRTYGLEIAPEREFPQKVIIENRTVNSLALASNIPLDSFTFSASATTSGAFIRIAAANDAQIRALTEIITAEYRKHTSISSPTHVALDLHLAAFRVHPQCIPATYLTKAVAASRGETDPKPERSAAKLLVKHVLKARSLDSLGELGAFATKDAVECSILLRPADVDRVFKDIENTLLHNMKVLPAKEGKPDFCDPNAAAEFETVDLPKMFMTANTILCHPDFKKECVDALRTGLEKHASSFPFCALSVPDMSYDDFIFMMGRWKREAAGNREMLALLRGHKVELLPTMKKIFTPVALNAHLASQLERYRSGVRLQGGVTDEDLPLGCVYCGGDVISSTHHSYFLENGSTQSIAACLDCLEGSLKSACESLNGTKLADSKAISSTRGNGATDIIVSPVSANYVANMAASPAQIVIPGCFQGARGGVPETIFGSLYWMLWSNAVEGSTSSLSNGKIKTKTESATVAGAAFQWLLVWINVMASNAILTSRKENTVFCEKHKIVCSVPTSSFSERQLACGCCVEKCTHSNGTSHFRFPGSEDCPFVQTPQCFKDPRYPRCPACNRDGLKYAACNKMVCVCGAKWCYACDPTKGPAFHGKSCQDVYDHLSQVHGNYFETRSGDSVQPPHVHAWMAAYPEWAAALGIVGT